MKRKILNIILSLQLFMTSPVIDLHNSSIHFVKVAAVFTSSSTVSGSPIMWEIFIGKIMDKINCACLSIMLNWPRGLFIGEIWGKSKAVVYWEDYWRDILLRRGKSGRGHFIFKFSCMCSIGCWWPLADMACLRSILLSLNGLPDPRRSSHIVTKWTELGVHENQFWIFRSIRNLIIMKINFSNQRYIITIYVVRGTMQGRYGNFSSPPPPPPNSSNICIHILVMSLPMQCFSLILGNNFRCWAAEFNLERASSAFCWETTKKHLVAMHCTWITLWNTILLVW